MYRLRSASVLIFLGLAVSCGKKDENSPEGNELTLKPLQPDGRGLDDLALVEWVPGQASDTKTLTMNITYQAAPSPGVAPINGCLNLSPDDAIGQRTCEGRQEVIQIKHLKIVCYGLGEGGRPPLEPLASCPGSRAFHYVNFNYPVKFTLE